MEKQESKWKKLIGKGAFVVVCILIAIALLAGVIYATVRVQTCVQGPRTYATPAPTEEPEETPLPNRLYEATRHASIIPPLSMLDINDGDDTYNVMLDLPYRYPSDFQKTEN